MEKFTYYLKQMIQSVSRGLWGYLVAALKLALLGFGILAAGLWIIGVDYWFLKAIGIAIVDIIPVLGSGIVMIPWALVHFFQGNTTLAWQIGLLFIVLVVVRQVAEPVLTGRAIGVRPIYTFLATIVCIMIFGPLGAVLGAVVAVVLKSIFSIQSFQKNEYE
ncbi:AI-2E family transporter [Jeotgalibaca caeni]|uniref:AI-2E family transporter n=1 Tax=Jeotgalibaca caeni TaxID=3028623 RepID=UPI00237D38E8|nr:AI-2E family transporter [Jeotgalibaca caeni]MDE1548335.1 AI-2E family transporter [Jeotgalibaca caeni]